MINSKKLSGTSPRAKFRPILQLKFIEGTRDEALDDAQEASNALRNMLNIFWRHVTGRSGGAGDFASFTRNLAADTAEVIEEHAGAVKNRMRETEGEVQEGKADPVTGIQRSNDEAHDTKERYERGMDTAKIAGSTAIGAGQQVKQSRDELGEKTSRNLDDLFDRILLHAERDPEYRNSVTAVFDIISKWFNRSIDNVDRNSIDEIIHDPTGRVPAALSSINILLERLAGDKSTRDLKEALRVVLIDIRDDPALRSYFDEVHDFARRTLQEPTYARSPEHEQRRSELRDRWNQLLNGEDRRAWHGDIERLQRESDDFFGRIQRDEDVRRLQEASIIFGNDFASAAEDLAATATGNANWLWQDVADVLLPKIIENLKNIPIPRTEYKDPDTEFVLEDLKLETFHLLPGHAHIRNTTDMNIAKETAGASTQTKVRSHTQIHFKGVHLKIHDASFWYNDKGMKPISEVSGLMGVELPERGVDIDVSLGLIPQPGKKEHNSDQHAFFTVDHVNVTLNEPSFSIRKSNHPILFTAFKPMIRSRLEKAIETSLSQQITLAIQMLDNIAFDIHRRSGVFRDTGMSSSASYASALWSELGHLRQQPGLFSGLKTTSVGIVKDDPRQKSAFAMGAQPQIISGEKHGPAVPGSNAQERREQGARLAEESKDLGQQGARGANSGVASFANEIKFKKEQEEKQDTWRSGAFEAPKVSH
ncbi:hypothetical protein M422DRAFT_64470 [Sphaerobolus stellatus SS14]|nr:hypothetical protein M422DRAFT_64470 [Sphaerobolus stellatus SS14]